MYICVLNLMGNPNEKRHGLLHFIIHNLLLCFLTDSSIWATQPPHSGESFSTVCVNYTHQNNLEQIYLKHNQVIIGLLITTFSRTLKTFNIYFYKYFVEAVSHLNQNKIWSWSLRHSFFFPNKQIKFLLTYHFF